MTLRRPLFALLAILAAAPALADGTGFPVTITSCGRDVTIEAPPARAIATGSNLDEIMLALGLEDRMAGFTGRLDLAKTRPFFPAADRLRQIQSTQPTMEMILDEDIDFVFSGWSYGLRIGGEVTPETLARYGVPTYELSESCVRIGQFRHPDFEFLFRDLKNLATAFGVPERADALIGDARARLARVAARVAGQERPRVFVYDSGEGTPYTAGGYAMPQAIIEAAGGDNLAAILDGSWVRIDWETVAELNPEAIVVVDYGPVTAAQKLDYLRGHPALAHVDAVRNDRFLVLDFDELTPGPRNIDAVEKLAAFLHPDRG